MGFGTEPGGSSAGDALDNTSGGSAEGGKKVTVKPVSWPRMLLMAAIWSAARIRRPTLTVTVPLEYRPWHRERYSRSRPSATSNGTESSM